MTASCSELRAEWLRDPPTDFATNVEYRIALINQCDLDPSYRADVLALCATDVAWTFNSFFYTLDPRKTPSAQPFTLWPHERRFVETLEANYRARRDLLVEKSRDMGCTWTFLCWALWHWRFDPTFHAIFGSRLEDLIDEKGNLDTHFERLRWELRRLPSWWLPAGFTERDHCPYMRLLNPVSENTIVGEAVTADFSRQGRYNVAFLDEFASCDQAEGAWTATADSTPMRVPVSNPKGLGNKFAQLRKSHTIDVMSLHWSLHPEKRVGLYCEQHGKPALDSCAWPTCKLRSTWYDAECSRREALEVAQELDIDYLGGGNPYFDLQALERTPAEEPLVRGFLVEVDRGVEFRAHEDGIWSLWELPPPTIPGTAQPAIPAIIGADVAEGIGQDYSVAVVRDARDRGLKAALRTHMNTDEFAHELAKAGRFYHLARIGCERNGPGFAVNAELVKCYGNLYHEVDVQKFGQPQTKRFGWRTDARTKELMLTQMREEIREHAAALRWKVLIEECTTLIVDEDGKVHADGGYHDDCVIAWAIAGALMQQQPYTPVRRMKPQPELAGSNLCG